MASIRELLVKIGADTTGFSSGIDSASRKLSDFGGNLVTAGAGITALTAPLGLAGAAAIKAAGDYEQLEIAFKTLLGSGEKAKAFLLDLEEFAKQTPFEFTGLAEAAPRMLAMGFAADQIIPSLRTIGDTVALIGGGQQKIDNVTDALGKMITAGTVQAQEMNRLTDAGIRAWDILAEAIGTDTTRAMKAVKDRAVEAKPAVEAILKSLNETFGGGMAAQMDTFQGKLSNVQDELDKVARNLGQALLPAGKSLIENFILPGIENLNDLVTAFRDLPQPVQTASGALAAIGVASGPVMLGLGAVVFAVGQITGALNKMATAALGASGASGLGAVVAAGGKIVALVAGFAAVVAQFWAIKEAAQAIVDTGFEKVFGIFREDAEAMAGVLDSLNTANNNTLTSVTNLEQKLKDEAAAMFAAKEEARKKADELQLKLKPAYEAVAGQVGSWRQELRDAEAAKAEAARLDDQQARALGDVESKMKDLNRELGTLAQKQHDAERAIRDATRAIFDQAIEAQNLGSNMGSAGREALEEFGKIPPELLRVENKAKDVNSAVTQISTAVNDFGRDVAKVLIGQGSVGDAFKSLGETILRIAGEQVMGFLIKQVGKLLEHIPGLNQIAGILSGISGDVGGAAQSAGGSIPGGGTGGAGAAGGGAASVVTAGASIGSLISGVIGNFQNARQETTLNAIEENTRRGTLYLGDRGDGGIMAQQLKIAWELQYGNNTKATEEIRNHILIHTAVLEQMRDAIVNGAVLIGGGGGSIASPEDIVAASEDIDEFNRTVPPRMREAAEVAKGIPPRMREVEQEIAAIPPRARGVRSSFDAAFDAAYEYTLSLQELNGLGPQVSEAAKNLAFGIFDAAAWIESMGGAPPAQPPAAPANNIDPNRTPVTPTGPGSGFVGGVSTSPLGQVGSNSSPLSRYVGRYHEGGRVPADGWGLLQKDETVLPPGIRPMVNINVYGDVASEAGLERMADKVSRVLAGRFRGTV